MVIERQLSAIIQFLNFKDVPLYYVPETEDSTRQPIRAWVNTRMVSSQLERLLLPCHRGQPPGFPQEYRSVWETPSRYPFAQPRDTGSDSQV